MAATILIGQCIGANNIAETKRVVGTSATFFAAISVAHGDRRPRSCAEPLLIAMSTPADSLPLAVAYMRVIFLALPFLYMYAFVMAVLRGAGDSKTPFYFMLLSVGIDIALNPVFIFGLGPMPRLGIAGSALATFVAQAVSLTALIRHLYRRQACPVPAQATSSRCSRWTGRWSATLVRKGIPMSAQMLVISLSGVLMITLVNRFGVDTTAAFGAALQIWNYIQMPAFAVGMARVRHDGAERRRRASGIGSTRIARVGVLYSVLLTGSIVLADRAARPAGSSRCSCRPARAALGIASHMNRIVTPSFIFFGISVALFGVVRATGAVMAPLIDPDDLVAAGALPARGAVPRPLPGGCGVVELPGVLAPVRILALLYYRYGGWRGAHMLPAGT